MIEGPLCIILFLGFLRQYLNRNNVDQLKKKNK